MSSNILDVENIRSDFPILDKKVNGKKLVYFDNAATSQTPKQVINVISDYYLNYNSNIHRGVHFLSQKATEKYENTRKKFKEHLNANSTKEIIFTLILVLKLSLSGLPFFTNFWTFIVVVVVV